MRRIIFKTFIAILLLLLAQLWSAYQYTDQPTPAEYFQLHTPDPESLKLAAFEVLKTHCNTCHITDNPSKVFTLENMNKLAKKIHRQVFFFRRMPKGKERREKITAKEMATLKKWVDLARKK